MLKSLMVTLVLVIAGGLAHAGSCTSTAATGGKEPEPVAPLTGRPVPTGGTTVAAVTAADERVCRSICAARLLAYVAENGTTGAATGAAAKIYCEYDANTANSGGKVGIWLNADTTALGSARMTAASQ